MQTAQKIVNKFINKNIFPLAYMLHTNIFNILVSIGLTTRAHMLKGYEISPLMQNIRI